jgi:hypothetical protein
MDLASSNGDWLNDSDRPYLGAIKRVTTNLCLRVDPRKIGIDRQAWPSMRHEAVELRMMLVSVRLTAKYCPSQQALPP